MNEIKLWSEALRTYKEFFGTLPDLYKKEDVDELHAIYEDICYMYENIQNRATR